MINEGLKNIITPSSMLSYTGACMSLCNKIMDLQKDNYNNFIIPSRGAYPFYYDSSRVYYSIKDSRKDYFEYLNRQKVWLLPFTSDWGDADINITSLQSRRFWVKILDDCLNRRSTPFQKFYHLIVENLGPRFAVNPSELLPSEAFLNNNSDGFVFIDTVVSGRAIVEIINSLHEFNIQNYYLILLVDANGKKLNKEYADIIHKEIFAGKAHMIFVEQFFSEDASPLLNGGICSMVFPSLMEEAINNIKDFKSDNLVGAGLWFNNAVTHLYNTRLNAVRGILSDLTGLSIRHQFNTDFGTLFIPEFDFMVEKMIEAADNFNLFDQDYTRRLVKKRIEKEVKLDDGLSVSSSHVLRVDLAIQCINDLKRQFRNF
jgi:hypothetical protein